MRISHILLLLGLLLGSARGADTITFSVRADSFATTIRDLHSGDQAATDEYVVGILFDITAYNHMSAVASVMGFCSEIAQPIAPGQTYTMDVVPLSQLAAATAGDSGSASSGMPSGGIGQLAAARVSYLYDNYYAGLTTSDWTRTSTLPDTLAFQIAQWEITHDSDLDLSTGELWIDPTNNTSTTRSNTLSLAQTWLDEIAAANVLSTYEAKNWDLIGGSSSTAQDVIIATARGFIPVPEPAGFIYAAVAILVLFGRRHR